MKEENEAGSVLNSASCVIDSCSDHIAFATCRGARLRRRRHRVGARHELRVLGGQRHQIRTFEFRDDDLVGIGAASAHRAQELPLRGGQGRLRRFGAADRTAADEIGCQRDECADMEPPRRPTPCFVLARASSDSIRGFDLSCP